MWCGAVRNGEVMGGPSRYRQRRHLPERRALDKPPGIPLFLRLRCVDNTIANTKTMLERGSVNVGHSKIRAYDCILRVCRHGSILRVDGLDLALNGCQSSYGNAFRQTESETDASESIGDRKTIKSLSLQNRQS